MMCLISTSRRGQPKDTQRSRLAGTCTDILLEIADWVDDIANSLPNRYVGSVGLQDQRSP